jgi:hypothetical protein
MLERGPPYPLFSEVFIIKDFKCFVFGSVHCKGVAGGFCGSADSKGVTGKTFEGRKFKVEVGSTGEKELKVQSLRLK